MHRLTRNCAELPEYYQRLTTKQKRNWRRNNRRVQHNEELRSKYPPFQSSSNIKIFYIHRRTRITILDELILEAKLTRLFTIDTESENHGRGTLVQIEMVHTTNRSTVLLFEVNHFPDPESKSFERINNLCEIIFDEPNEIVSWGPLETEFRDFTDHPMFETGKIKSKINIQSLFSQWFYTRITHPETEKRASESDRLIARRIDTIDEQDEETENKPYTEKMDMRYELISLQDAVATLFNAFLDEKETTNRWSCGLDLDFDTWKHRLFSRYGYNQLEEKEKRNQMVDYAVNDCLATTRIYFHFFTWTTGRKTNQQVEEITSGARPINSTQQLSIEEEEELLENLRPKFNSIVPSWEEVDLEVQVSPNEVNELVAGNQDEKSTNFESKTKSERQRLKNLKLKWKRKNRPDFQNKLKRPIYYRYDYKKIRAQLKEDKIQTTHQITIDTKKLEVMIGFRSEEEIRRARIMVPMEYFSRENIENDGDRGEN